ncbi:MAG TPA: acyl-CoA dehydrogenase, partial [Gammaproteobacteria bacterium]|nr:acyl-CoA dehydrogenase [Gammaproteobacteria bacterium]
AFAMTEPAPGAGSDPSMLSTRAERDGDGWVINGDKWFISGADGAAFAICMARTD